MFRCIYVTSNKITDKVTHKFKKITEKPSVVEAENKTKQIIEKFGKGVESTVNSMVASENFQNAKNSVERLAQRIKGNEHSNNFSASTVSVDESEVQVLDNFNNLS